MRCSDSRAIVVICMCYVCLVFSVSFNMFRGSNIVYHCRQQVWRVVAVALSFRRWRRYGGTRLWWRSRRSCGILLVVWLSAAIVAHKGLVDGEIQVTACGHLLFRPGELFGCYTHHGVLVQVAEVYLRLVGENVAVGKEVYPRRSPADFVMSLIFSQFGFWFL